MFYTKEAMKKPVLLGRFYPMLQVGAPQLRENRNLQEDYGVRDMWRDERMPWDTGVNEERRFDLGDGVKEELMNSVIECLWKSYFRWLFGLPWGVDR